ncbi:MAG: hypothetical protein ABI184_01630 [Ginsengibacter sp.]
MYEIQGLKTKKPDCLTDAFISEYKLTKNNLKSIFVRKQKSLFLHPLKKDYKLREAGSNSLKKLRHKIPP